MKHVGDLEHLMTLTVGARERSRELCHEARVLCEIARELVAEARALRRRKPTPPAP